MEPGRQGTLLHRPGFDADGDLCEDGGVGARGGRSGPAVQSALSGGILRREYDVAADGRFLINVSAVDAGVPQTIPIIVTVSSATGTPAQEDRVQSR